MPVAEIDKILGIETYITETAGIGGKIRESAEDFIVEEILVDGSKAQINPSEQKRVLGSSLERQRHLLCVMIKHHWDTLIAAKSVARQLGMGQNSVQIAGIKDAKAVTAQYISIENVSMEDAAKVDIRDITLRPIGYMRNPLSLFYLLGNSFKIEITGLIHEESFIKEQIEHTITKINQIGGIPNYYGHQRFGTTRPITHLVGKAILQGSFEEAAMIFLAKPSPDEHPISRQARSELQDKRDFKLALDHFPMQLRYERSMLNYLVEKPDDFAGAFNVLPAKLQGLFIQAYQSFLFNRFLSERAKIGLSLGAVEVGDFVVGIERSGLPMVNMAKIVTQESVTKINEAVTAGRIRVALPIVGFKQKLSEGVMGELERQVLAEEDVNLESFRVTANSKLGSRGGLRTAITPVKNFKLLKISQGDSGMTASIGFELLRGCYATVLLREIMKPENPILSGF